MNKTQAEVLYHPYGQNGENKKSHKYEQANALDLVSFFSLFKCLLSYLLGSLSLSMAA